MLLIIGQRNFVTLSVRKHFTPCRGGAGVFKLASIINNKFIIILYSAWLICVTMQNFS